MTDSPAAARHLRDVARLRGGVLGITEFWFSVYCSSPGLEK
ncbi:MAG TPA: hypothetical protein VMU65_00750 [Candidatus Saccharimonadales bacterium]|nr:hypothetical protein [Candidatus Saccharimonadales bacterium]